MGQDEISDFLKKIDIYKNKVTENKEESSKFLRAIGIFTKKGKVKKAFQDICIQHDPA
jgi:hypothetical protein